MKQRPGPKRRPTTARKIVSSGAVSLHATLPAAVLDAKPRDVPHSRSVLRSAGRAEVPPHDVKFRRTRSARTCAYYVDPGEAPIEARAHFRKTSTHEQLGHHRRTRSKHRAVEREGSLVQVERQCLVALGDTAELGLEIARDQIGGTSECPRDRVPHRRFANIADDRHDIRAKWGGRAQIDSYHATAITDRCSQNREPSPGRTS